ARVHRLVEPDDVSPAVRRAAASRHAVRGAQVALLAALLLAVPAARDLAEVRADLGSRQAEARGSRIAGLTDADTVPRRGVAGGVRRARGSDGAGGAHAVDDPVATFELARRAAAVARGGVAVVALLEGWRPLGVDEPITATGVLTVREAVVAIAGVAVVALLAW